MGSMVLDGVEYGNPSGDLKFFGFKEDNKLYIYRNQFLAAYSSNTLYENTGNSYITFDTTNGMEGYVDGSYQTPASKGSIFLITTKGAV